MNGRTNSNGVGTDILQVPLDPPENLTATAGNAKVSLTWVDPVDKYATPEGETAQDPQQLVSEWDYTVVVRKVGSQPNDPNDGTIVTKSSIRNQYQTSPYEDTGLINDTVYYYGVFAVNKDGVASDGDYTDAVIPKLGTPLSELPEGTIIKINENGSPVEYIVVNKGLPSSMYDESCDGCWVLRKDIAEKRIWDSSANQFKNSGLYSYLNNIWITRYPSNVISHIKQAKIPYHNSIIDSGCKIFIPSAVEIGFTAYDSSYLPNDGFCLSYFDVGSAIGNNRRIAKYNGTANNWCTRSPMTLYNDTIFIVDSYGECDTDNCTAIFNTEFGIRPLLILQDDTYINDDMIIL